MLSINTNLSSLIAQNSMKTSTDKLNQAIERMTTGFKINHAKDNAANYSISTDMTTKIGAYQVAEDNCAQGLDMIATASESLSLIQDKLERLRALATQASNGTYGAQSLKAINAEANALVDEIERQYNTTEYNGINLAKGKVISTEESKFIKDIDRRDTSKMTTLASVAIDEALTSGTYSISTADELAKLATMTNNGLIGRNTEFVLANDIDLNGISNWTPIGNYQEGVSFRSVFDGNGYKILNLKINSSELYNGLFGSLVENAKIKNLAIHDADVYANRNYQAILASSATDDVLIDNCYTTGRVQGYSYVGGLISSIYKRTQILNSYSEALVIARKLYAGGLVGFNGSAAGTHIEMCYAEGDVSGVRYVGGLIGRHYDGRVINSYAIGNVTATDGIDYGDLIGDIAGDDVVIEQAVIDSIKNEASIVSHDYSLNLQVGTNSDTNSQIGTSIGYVLDNLNAFRNIGYYQFDYVSLIDSVISSLSSKQTEYGAVQNRLESALDEISIKYENLVSSRSTLRDADIAKVSSTYIQQQILQQASATLMATANQSPAIALQLI